MGKIMLNGVDYSAANTGSNVTGIKGNAETTYRTGNVNLTPANIGALPLSGGAMNTDANIYMNDSTGISGGITMQSTNGNSTYIASHHSGETSLTKRKTDVNLTTSMAIDSTGIYSCKSNSTDTVPKLGTVTVGSGKKPVYMEAGIITECGDSLDADITGNAASATKLETARNINGMSVDGTADRANYGVCSTAGDTAAKIVTCEGFALVTSAEITVKFIIPNTAANPTLNVNSTGAKAIYYRGAAIPAGYLAAGGIYTFRYSGSYYELVGDINTDTNTHYASKNVVGASTSTSNTASALSNGNVYLNSVENGAVTSSHKISGSGAITVTTDTNGNIVINSTDTNTTYSAGTGISLSGTTFSNSGVRSIATGTANGTISVNTNGTTADVAVKGLGSAAYTASTAYAAASHTHSYLPLGGGTMTGQIKMTAGVPISLDGSSPSLFSGGNQKMYFAASDETNYQLFYGVTANLWTVCPITDGSINLGYAGQRWGNIYSTSGAITTSDRNYKDNIAPLTDKHAEFFRLLLPVSFTFKDSTSGRTHIGFVAQDVEAAMEKTGLTALDFAGFCKDIKYEKYKDENGEEHEKEVLDENGNPIYIYSLRYEEFVALITFVLQAAMTRLDTIEARLDALEKIQAV